MAEKFLDIDLSGPRATTVEMSAGDRLNVQLPGRTSGGYTWSATTEATDVSVEKAPARSEVRSSAMGASVPETYAVQSQRPGEYELVLSLKRPWESAPRETRILTLKVN